MHRSTPAGTSVEVLAATDLALLVWQLYDADDPGGMQLLYATQASRSLTFREVADAVGLYDA